MFDAYHHENAGAAPITAPIANPPLVSLFRYLAGRGGLRDHPELRAVLDGNPVVSGNGRLLRARGLTLDRAWEAACEGGYIFDPGFELADTPLVTDWRDLLDLLRAEAHGQNQYPVGRAPRERAIDPAETELWAWREQQAAGDVDASPAMSGTETCEGNRARNKRGTSMPSPAKKAANGAFKPMTAAEYKRVREKLGLSNYALAPAIGVSRRQAIRYEGGAQEIPEPIAKLLRVLVKHGIDPMALD